MFESINRMDWDLLHRQKRVLVQEASKDRLKQSVAEALWGIVHLLDALQDDAVAAGRWTFPGDRGVREVRHGKQT